jgi:hypothetical protein
MRILQRVGNFFEVWPRIVSDNGPSFRYDEPRPRRSKTPEELSPHFAEE